MQSIREHKFVVQIAIPTVVTSTKITQHPPNCVIGLPMEGSLKPDVVLGLCYASGESAAQDFATVIKLYSEAAYQGRLAAQEANGSGQEKGAEDFEQLNDGRHSDGKLWIRICFNDGRGT
ncbi:uncharacterized protein BJ171DRAFT_476609 [Polychytrium aggregatum]|uniref:uncharacterized protein n=1 Tax=Polychytrium aggregatum TaxID=110093 RepID=UPI0022FF3D26|nr:uncharacterized protein BJ171DRAFT_476609 [Polychytrium aggregatum]KAI9202610.1 hypothetical protein BJ171DRAFT_476609 [Polychytrium aggregatum]